jgi:hypothetical protein
VQAARSGSVTRLQGGIISCSEGLQKFKQVIVGPVSTVLCFVGRRFGERGFFHRHVSV